MQILHSQQEYHGAASVLALGTFDGVHVGHAALIRRAREIAARRGAQCVVCSFDRHPLCVLDPARAPRQLTSTQEKCARLARLGVDCVLLEPFTQSLAAMPAREYLTNLTRAMRAVAVVVGQNHRFGHRGEGDARLTRELGRQLGFEAVIVPPVYDGGEMVSSTLIRALLASGQEQRARRLMQIQARSAEG